jgi:hypothetical protein
MQRIGQWIKNLLDETFIAPQEIADTMEGALRVRVADYLASGREIARYRCSERCTYRCHERLACIDFTDGFWIWRAEYEHGVRLHGAPVPEALIRTVLYGERPQLTDDDSTDSDAFWRLWCSSRRNPDFLADLKEARLAAYVDVERELAEQTVETAHRFGTGSGGCAYAKCVQPALNASAICARHTVLGHQSLENWGLHHFLPGALLRRWTDRAQ